jgi:hypothetical protein
MSTREMFRATLPVDIFVELLGGVEECSSKLWYL